MGEDEYGMRIDLAALNTQEGCHRLFDDLLESPPAQLGRVDLGLLNLLCAPALPGSEKLDIPRCLARLDRLAAFVKDSTERNLHRFPSDPDHGHSEPMWRMAMLVTSVKRDFGASYSPAAMADLKAGKETPFTDSREVFIHGLLDDSPNRRWGTCASIPVLVAAIARRLGYPVGLAVTLGHIFARWENGACFNTEASNPAGMTSPGDGHYRDEFRGGLTAEDKASGHYVRTLSPAEEFAVFFQTRVHFLLDAGRYDETLLWAARALQFSPDDPRFPLTAYQAADQAIKQRFRQRHPEQKLPASDDPNQPVFPLGELLAVPERSLYLTIVAHFQESKGQLVVARQAYEDSCRQNFHGNNEQRDLQRFLRQHGLPRRRGPLLPPQNLGQPRIFKLSCPPHEEAAVLRGVADEFERNGELLKAREALRDLYMFDPGDAEVFQRAREITARPQCQAQLRAAIAQQQQRRRF